MKSLSLSQPHLIVIVGIPGSGKTHFAEKFAQTFHAPYLSLEKLIPHVTDAPAAKEIALQLLGEFLKTKQPVIIEGASDTRSERTELVKKARDAGYATLVVWVQTDQVTAKNRSIKPPRGSDKKPLTTEEFERNERRFTPPNAFERPVVISGKHTYASQAKVVLKRLTTPRAEMPTLKPVAPPPGRTPLSRRNITIR
jgi:predicted kinase